MSKRKKKLYKQIFNEIWRGLISALPFGNFFDELAKNIKENRYSPAGQINYPKLICYLITALICAMRVLGIIDNSDLRELIEAINIIDAQS